MNKTQRFTFKKNECVTGVKRIECLFAHGKSFMTYPLRTVFIYREQRGNSSRVALFISVPKKRLKRAVHRNRIKRLIREVYRLNKHLFDCGELDACPGIDIGMIYVKDGLSDYVDIEKSVKKALREVAIRVKRELEA